jgi:hypothetical protein
VRPSLAQADRFSLQSKEVAIIAIRREKDTKTKNGAWEVLKSILQNVTQDNGNMSAVQEMRKGRLQVQYRRTARALFLFLLSRGWKAQEVLHSQG